MSMHNASHMRKLKIAVIICCLILVLSTCSCSFLSQKFNTVIGKDEISENLDTIKDSDSNYNSVSSCLRKCGIRNINTYKVNEAENKLRSHFYKDLPSSKDLGEKVAALFLESYYDKIDLNDKDAVTDAVLDCLIKSIGDRWAYYRTAKQFEDYSNSLEGGEEFVGIGIQINTQTLEITMVFRDSGAEEAGIKPGDILYAVEDKTSENTAVDDLVNMIRGEVGSTVRVTVKRGDKLIEFNITRKTLTERSVYYKMEDARIGYIQITQFLYDTVAQFKEAVDYLTQNGAVALVIDVRYNPGGLLASVVDVIDYLTPDSPDRRICSYNQDGEEIVFYTRDGHSVNIPIAVICNEYTASAGELFTGAMRDYGKDGVLKTVIVGNTTYGKGVAQNSYYLYDKSALTFTIGYFNPPCNVNFDGIGVIPNVEAQEAEDMDVPLAVAKEQISILLGTSALTEEYFDIAA